MSGSTYDITTDPKWTKFLAAFDKALPKETDLSKLRESVTTTLDDAETQLTFVPGGASKTKIADRITALRNDLNRSDRIERAAERLAALQDLQKKATEIRTLSDTEKTKSGKKLGQQKTTGVYAVQSMVASVERIDHPALKLYIQPFLDPVKQKLAAAERKKSPAEITKAIIEIDYAALSQEFNGLFGSLNKLGGVRRNMEDARFALDGLTKDLRTGDAYKDANSALQSLTKRYETIMKAGAGDLKTDVGALQTDSVKVKKDAQALLMPTGGTKLEQENSALLKPLMLVLDEADKIMSTCNAAGVQGPLGDLENAMNTAEAGKDDALLAGTDKEKAKNVAALCVPVQVAIAKIQDALKGVPRMLGNVGKMVAGLKNDTLKGTLGQELTGLQTAFETAVKSGDGLDDIKAKLVEMIEQVAKTTKQDKYELLLQTQFGVTTERKGLPFKKNLKGTYDAMCMVPDSHVGQDKLQKVVFNYAKATPYGSYDDTVVSMEGKLFDFTKITFAAYKLMYKEPPFTVDGKAYEPNAFNITMLHEIGHSIDDKQNIMDPREGSSPYGTWKAEGTKGVIDACTDHLATQLKITDEPRKGAIRECIAAAIAGNTPKQPKLLDKAAWATVKDMCTAALASRTDKEPWYTPAKAINIGGRVFHEPYGDDWVSYALADRKPSLTVSSYQWRAPGEFFACIYSVAWMQEKTVASLAGLFDDWLPPKA